MRHYVILCETMNRADQLYKRAIKVLGPVMRYMMKHPMLTIETKDDVRLYFTCDHHWFDRGGRLGRLDWVILSEWYFERMLDKWDEVKRNDD